MNLELLQTVDQSYPEHNDGILDSGSEALTCSFNRRGTLLAVGCNDGRIAVWDFMTRGIARMCNSHIHPITFLSWNRSSRKLLSSSTDWNVLLWDIASGEIDLRFRFPSPVLKAQFHPRNSNIFLVCPMKNVPVLVKREGDEYKHFPLPTDGEPELNIVASFDRRGGRIVTGSSKGKILVVDTNTREILKSFKLTGSSATAVKSIEFARRGSNFLVNSSDRVIRVYDIEEIMKSKEGEAEALQRLQDLVNRTQWKKCTFSGDGEFIVAGSHRQHALYIWDKGTGSLAKMLTGQKGETLLDIAWHPVRPIILSISTGVVNVWSQAQVELWSAYAPNFKELDENDEYEEKEDEFDIEDEDRFREGEGEEGGEEENMIDILGIQPIPAFCSSDEDVEEPLDWLPMAPEIEDPEEPGWGQLEPSLNELPAADASSGGGRKRPHANDENVDPSTQPPVAKQPRTIEIDLPNRYDDSLETNHKEVKTKSQKDSKSGKKGRSGAKSSTKSQKTEGQAQPSANGKGTSLNTSKDTSTTKVEDSLVVSNTESSAISKDSSGRDSSAHGKDSTDSGRDSSAHGKDSTDSGRGSFVHGKDSTDSGRDSSAHGKDSTDSGRDSSAHGKDSTDSGRDTWAHGKDSTANGRDILAHGKDSTASGKDTSNEKCSSANSTDTTVQVEVMEEMKTDQEVASEAGEGSRQVEQHESENASSVGENETKAELITTIGKELEPMCGGKDEPSAREEEIEVEVSNLVGEGASAQSEEVEKQPVATTPGTPPPLLHIEGDDL